MGSHQVTQLAICVVIVCICVPILAEVPPSDTPLAAALISESTESAVEAKQQTEPAVALSRVGFEDWYTASYHGEPGGGNEVVFRDTITFDLGRFDSISRITVPFVTSSPPQGGLGADSADDTETASGPTGLGDIEVYDLAVLKANRGQFTVGPTFSFPSARNSANGSSKWEVGPAGGFTLQPSHWHVGFFTENFFSFAGDANARSVAKTKIQPIFYYDFPRGWSLGISTMNFTYNWESHDWTNLPIGMRIGKLIPIGSETIDASIEGEYNLRDQSGSSGWTVRLKFYFVFPDR
jgi:hypothetical protein